MKKPLWLLLVLGVCMASVATPANQYRLGSLGTCFQGPAPIKTYRKYWGPDLSVYGTGGMNMCRLKGPTTKTLFRPGFSSGFLISYDAFPEFRIASGFTMLTKGYGISDFQDDIEKQSDRYFQFGYLSIPVLLTLTGDWNKAAWFVQGGFYASVLLNARYQYKSQDMVLGTTETVEQDFADQTKGFAAGLQAGGGVLFPLGGKRSERDWEYGFAISMERGLSRVFEQGEKATIRGYALEILLRYRFY